MDQPYRWGVLSDATGDITADCAGIWLHRTCIAQNGNLAGVDCPCHQQESPEQSRRHSFGTAPEVRFGTALDLAEHSCGRRSHLVLSRYAARTGSGLRTHARRATSTHCRLRKHIRLRDIRSFRRIPSVLDGRISPDRPDQAARAGGRVFAHQLWRDHPASGRNLRSWEEPAGLDQARPRRLITQVCEPHSRGGFGRHSACLHWNTGSPERSTTSAMANLTFGMRSAQLHSSDGV